MKIAVDCSKLNTEKKTGTHRFLTGFLEELSKRKDIELTFYFNYLDKKLVNYPFLKKGDIKILETKLYTQLGLLKEIEKFDYFIFPWQTVPVLSFFTQGNAIAIIHDSGYTFKTKFFTFLAQIFAKVIFSVSESTRKSLLRNSFVITEGVDEKIFYKIKEDDLRKLKLQHGLPEKFLLSVGRIEERKNIFNNIKAFSKISKFYPNLKYCFIGNFEIEDKLIYSFINSLDINPDQIIFKNYVDDEVLNLYLNSCEFLIFTSQDEGFGLPVLEAYSIGKWVVLSEIQQLAEFVLSAKQVVPHNNPQEIASTIVYFLTNKLKLKKEFNPSDLLKKFSWKNSVDLFLEKLESYDRK